MLALSDPLQKQDRLKPSKECLLNSKGTVSGGGGMELWFIQLLVVQRIFHEPALCARWWVDNGETGGREPSSDFRRFDKLRC